MKKDPQNKSQQQGGHGKPMQQHEQQMPGQRGGQGSQAAGQPQTGRQDQPSRTDPQRDRQQQDRQRGER